MTLHIAYHTHPGQKRKLNEDSLSYLRLNLQDPMSYDWKIGRGDLPENSGVIQQGPFHLDKFPAIAQRIEEAGLTSSDIYLLLVADGMGGHRAGEVASGYVVRRFLFRALKGLLLYYSTEKGDDCGLTTAFSIAVREINQEVRALGESDEDHYGNMGTTLTGILIIDETAFVVNVGDSRTYVLRAGSLDQLSTDHSFVQALVDAGAITEEEAQDHPQRNVITRTIGTKPEVKPDVVSTVLGLGDIVLLCSDGLTDLVGNDEIQEILLNNSIEKATIDLVAKANERGGKDNITVMVAEVT